MKKKQMRTLAVLAAVAVALVILLAVLLSGEEQKRPDGLIVVNEVKPDSIVELHASKDGFTVDLAKKGDVWTGKNGEQAVDQLLFETALTQLAYLYASDVVAEEAGDKKPFGLDHPALTVQIQTKDQKKYAFAFGEETTDKKHRYLMMQGSERLYLFPAEKYQQIMNGVQPKNNLALDIDAENLQYLHFVKDGTTPVTMKLIAQQERVGNERWKLEEPFEAAGNNRLAALVTALFSPARLASDEGEERPEHEIGSKGILELQDTGGKAVRLNLGSRTEDGRYYCTVEGREGVYTIYAGFEELLGMDIQNCVQKNILMMDETNIDSFILEIDGERLEYDAQKGTLNKKELTEQQRNALFAAMGELNFDGLTQNTSLEERMGGMEISGRECLVFFPYMNEFISVSRYEGSAPVYIKKDKLKELLFWANELAA